MQTQSIHTFPFLTGGGEMGNLTRAFDWARSPVGDPASWPQSLRTTVAMILSSRFPMFLWWGPDLLQFYNDAYRPSLGNPGKHPMALGQPGQTCWPEIWPTIKPLIDQVMAGGEAVWQENQLIPIARNGRLEDVYWTFSYSAVLNEWDQVGGVLVVCQETTASVLSHQKVAQSEARFRDIVEQAPMAIGLLRGREMVIEVGNDTIFELWGKDASITGVRLIDALPEIKNQIFMQLLEDVYDTGKPFLGNSVLAKLERHGKLENAYFDFVYTPLRDIIGEITGVMVLATDVTGQVLIRQQVEEAENRLRGAIELAELATWEIDIVNQTAVYSDRLQAWGGFQQQDLSLVDAMRILHEDDLAPLEAALAAATVPGSAGTYDLVFTLVNRQTSEERVIHSVGKVYVDPMSGLLLKISGVGQDVTEQRTLQLALEQQVQQRTRQLQASIQELQRSNENLQQFAYIASHDLQEPLRKIQSFGDILKAQYAAELGEGIDSLQRMQAAASRMSMLVKDLLTYARITTQRDTTTFVSLPDVVQTVLSDLDLIIAETGAQVTIGPLPTVAGDALQLGQLCQNLLSNALKFRRPGIAPVIEVCAERLTASQLPPTVKPAQEAAVYQCLEVSDNGIGFELKHLTRMFQIFQRLHGKSKYAGTGIGLAICEKIVLNHGGAISAMSQPGLGATFRVYLPASA